jgi:biotin carboxyl carrier protein
MEIQEIRRFLKSIQATDIEELKYQSGNDSIRFKKDVVVSIPIKKNILPTGIKVKSDIADEAKQEIPKSNIVQIKSIMVGTFSDVLDSNNMPTIKEGVRIAKGQKVGQIEAMKIIKDIVSDIDGIIVKSLVSNGEPIEYAQPLFLVDISVEEQNKDVGEKSV